MRYVIKIAYDGTEYGGWQIQKNTVTVQQKLEEACFETFGKKTSVTASGRTDSGVHAAGQICHFDAETTIPADKIADVLNAKLPEDIAVIKAAQAPAKFDANRSAKKKDLLLPRLSFATSQPFKRQIRAVDKNSRRYN